MSCPDGYADCLCGTVPMVWNTNHGYILKQVVDEVGRELSDKEKSKVIEMINLGCTNRQMVAEVKRIACYEYANQRREAYIKKMKELGTGPLTGAASIKFKAYVDKQDGVFPKWEKQGYPAAYRSDTLEKSQKTKRKTKEKVASTKKKELKEQMEKNKPSKTKKKTKVTKTCLEVLNSMDVVD